MTAYFDEMAREIEAVDWQSPTSWDDYGAIEARLVRDVTICAMWPQCPFNIRRAIQRLVLQYAVQELPREAEPADFEHNSEYGRRLREMASSLHSLFHGLAHVGGSGFGDSPLHPLTHLAGDGHEERVRMVSPPFVRAPRGSELENRVEDARLVVEELRAELAHQRRLERELEARLTETRKRLQELQEYGYHADRNELGVARRKHGELARQLVDASSPKIRVRWRSAFTEEWALMVLVGGGPKQIEVRRPGDSSGSKISRHSGNYQIHPDDLATLDETLKALKEAKRGK